MSVYSSRQHATLNRAQRPRVPRIKRTRLSPPNISKISVRRLRMRQSPPAACGDMNGGGDQHVDFAALMQTKIAEKPETIARQQALLDQRYDLSDKPSSALHMTGGKALQEGVRVRLPDGQTWDSLAALTPDEIRTRDLFPSGFFPLPHPKQPEGGMLFPHFHIEEILRQTGRDLTRFDLDFDLPDQFLPEFPPPMFLTTRPDLGDVSQGQLITSDNYYELFKCVLNPKQIDGLRLLLTPFAQQQFNLIDDRRSEHPSLGVACFDCHAKGHTNAGTHLVGDIRPQESRHRIDTPSLRGVNIQKIFGSQRALSSVEDFTEFEQRGAYFLMATRCWLPRRASIRSIGPCRSKAWRSFRGYSTFHLRRSLT